MVAEHGASHFVNVLVPLIMEEIVKAVKAVPLERISERICERIADVHVSQIVEQVTEVPKTSNRDRTLQCTAEQIFDVPGPEMVKTVGESAGDRFPKRSPAADCGADR